MSGKRMLLAVLTVLAIFRVSAVAQDEKNELTGILGRTFISDRGIVGPNAPPVEAVIYSGKGLSFEVNYARRLLVTQVYSISGEVPAMFNLREKLNSGGPIVPIDYRQIFITPAVRANLFPTTAVSPWISLGAGFGHFSENSNLLYDGGPNPGKSTTSGVIQGGIGLDVRVLHRFFIRGEARDFWSGQPDFPLADTGKTRQHNYFVGGGVMWRF
jgi:Putative beta-barrel porin-2, OmpL-like. bbp2